ncbi:hypothetical protein [Cohnella massiliensis]|uniref:hypothetical protein n=1 Tax=Cohnella massiliensis TaxID=1816691 RepID=UPI0009BAC201|nr:hypothetical protein [Cohnella massiliensis]
MKAKLQHVLVRIFASNAIWKVQRTLIWLLETTVILLGILGVTIGYLTILTLMGQQVHFELNVGKYVVSISVASIVAYYHCLRLEDKDKI